MGMSDMSEGLCVGGWWLEQDRGSQPMCLVPAAGGQQTSLPQTRCTWGVRVHLLSNPTLEQPLSRGPMEQVRGAGISTDQGVLGHRRGGNEYRKELSQPQRNHPQRLPSRLKEDQADHAKEACPQTLEHLPRERGVWWGVKPLMHSTPARPKIASYFSFPTI